MKKTFTLTHAKLKPARLIDAIKHEIKKYFKRERNKQLPAGADYWAFDCRFGLSEAEAEKVFPSDINKQIDAAVAQDATEFYVEILAKASNYEARPAAQEEDEI
ncbi:DUF6172 family protein [Oceanisphaera pacifica]|uniref:Uncharacterized protein n=1 Tax=Oceanisphaera pacifica TaxID=2818389 RepID=A0ABS3NGL2_9GAMM|nr:DUF6172 family protein [Oceanisphaera pacifica]MBO1519528.1 hypothetical protein [Oceanisphaera pacifica]